MLISILGLLLIALGLMTLALQRFYSSIPAKELRRLAARGDHLAAALYTPVAYGASMRLLLWTIFCLTLVGGFYTVMSSFVPLVAFIIICLSVAAVIFLQSLRLTVHSARLAVKIAPALNWVMRYVHWPFDVASHLMNRFRKHTAHSGLYEKEDVLDLIRQQKDQPDNRISHKDLQLLANAARFDDRQAADIVLPMSRAKAVKVDDHIGPVVLQELYDSGQNSFLVYEDTPDKVVGTLFLRDAIHAREGGRVGDLMHPRLCYVHEDFSLRQVLQAFTHTGQFMVVVINAFEQPVGVITLEHLLTQLVGEDAEGDFDAFENRTAVAAFVPQLTPEPVLVTDDEPESPPEDGAQSQTLDDQTSPETTGVIQSEQ